MDIKELAKAKRRFTETVKYIKESVSRGNPYDVPLCFIEDSFGTDPERVPYSVFELIDFAQDSNDKELCTWLASIDLKPFEEFVKAFLPSKKRHDHRHFQPNREANGFARLVGGNAR